MEGTDVMFQASEVICWMCIIGFGGIVVLGLTALLSYIQKKGEEEGWR